MKKFFITLALTFLFFFLFLPNTYALEIPCNSEEQLECSVLRFRGLYYNSGSYSSDYTGFLAPPNNISEFSKAYEVNDVLKSSYLTYVSNAEAGYYFKYDLKPDKVYNFNIEFYSDSSLNVKEISENYPFSFSAMYKDKVIEDSEYYTFNGIEVIEDTDVDNFPDWIKEQNSNNSANYTTHTVITIKLSFSTAIDSFQFTLGSAPPLESDIGLNMVLLKYSNVEATTSNNTYFTYYGFNITDSDDKPSEDKIDFDKPTEEDEAIFDSLDKCEALDIGCHVGNLGKMINNLFVRIGNFFVSFFKDFQTLMEATLQLFVNLFNGALQGVTGAFEELQELLDVKVDGGLTSIISAPLVYIRDLGNFGVTGCQDLHLNIGGWFNHSIIIPCPTTFYSRFETFFTIYQTITTGIIAYWCLINILALTLQFKEPFSDKIEVMDL